VTLSDNRRGLLASMTDAAGVRGITYTASGEAEGEAYAAGSDILSGYSIGRGFDALLRKDSMQAFGAGGAPLAGATSYGYDDASRLKTVSLGNLSATYTRSPNREVIGQTQTVTNGKRPPEHRLTDAT
jgi:hypothetical protein